MAAGDAFRKPRPGAPHLVVCPHCGQINRHHEDPLAPSSVAPDAVSICWSCRKPSVFTETLDLRVPTPPEWTSILASAEYQNTITAIALNPDDVYSALLSAFLSSPSRGRRDRRRR